MTGCGASIVSIAVADRHPRSQHGPHAAGCTVYSRFVRLPELERQIVEARAEHARIETLLDDCIAFGFEDRDFLARWGLFASEVEEHVFEEEQQVYPIAKRILGRDESEALEALFLQAQEVERARIGG